MSRDTAIRTKLQDLAAIIERDDPRAARMLDALAATMYSNCTAELGKLAERFLHRMISATGSDSAR